MRNAITFIFVIYFSVSPVYWLPGLSASNFATLKLALVASAVLLVWFYFATRGKLSFPKGVAGLVGFMVILLVSGGGFLQAELSVTILRFKDYLLAFIMMWTFFNLYKSGFDCNKILLWASLGLGLFCMLVVTSKYLGVPSWSGPREFIAPNLWTSGFGGSRTGWSAGLSLFSLVLLSNAIIFWSRRKYLIGFVVTSFYLVVIANQYMVSGRGGLLAALIGSVFLLMHSAKTRLVLAAGVVMLVMVVVGNIEYVAEQLRVESVINNSEVTSSDLNDLSTGRLESIIIAFKYGMQSPIYGHGFDALKFGHTNTEIHNLWVRLFVEAGIFLPLMFMLLVLTTIKAYFVISKESRKSRTKALTLDDYNIRLYASIVISGLVISMLEPRYLLGTFQTCALWWVSVGVLLSKKQKITSRRF